MLKRDKHGRDYVYQPAVYGDESSRLVIHDVQDVLFSDWLPVLMPGLLENVSFSDEDARTLRAALQNVEFRSAVKPSRVAEDSWFGTGRVLK